MCSIGWLKLKHSCVLFKNKDRAAGDPINRENIFIQDKEVAGLGNKRVSGLTIGVNKYGICITTAKGPKSKALQRNVIEASEISEKVLRKCKTVKEAAKIYLELAKGSGLCYNVIIGSPKQAVALELSPSMSSQASSGRLILRTNHFVRLKGYYGIDKEAAQRSRTRLKKLTQLVSEVKDSSDMMSVLKFHSNNDSESICRHNQYTETVASAVFEIKENKAKVHYLLNVPPCKGRFSEKTIDF